MVAGGIAAAALAGCTASTPATQTSATATTSAAISPAPGWQAAGDVDGAVRPAPHAINWLGAVTLLVADRCPAILREKYPGCLPV